MRGTGWVGLIVPPRTIEQDKGIIAHALSITGSHGTDKYGTDKYDTDQYELF